MGGAGCAGGGRCWLCRWEVLAVQMVGAGRAGGGRCWCIPLYAPRPVVQVKIVAETRDTQHANELHTALVAKYGAGRVRWDC